MPIKRLVNLLIALGACSLTLTVAILYSFASQGHERTTFPHPRAGNTSTGLFAYITERELVLIRDGQTIARVHRFFSDQDSLENKVVWTDDGSHVAFLNGATLLQEPISAEELITVDTSSGEVRYFHCPGCYDLTPVATDSILAVASTSDSSAAIRFLRFDLNSRRPPSLVHLNLPNTGETVRFFLASTQKYVITHQEALGDEAEQVELTRLDGRQQENLGYFDSNDYMLAAATENRDDTADRIAVAFRANPSGCPAQFPITIFNSSGGTFNTDMSGMAPPGHKIGADAGIQVNDLWWGIDQRFHATITSWTCTNSKRAESDQETLWRHSAAWELDGLTWMKDPIGRATMARQVSKDTWVKLVIPDCVGPITRTDIVEYCNTGVLYRDHDGKSTTMARGVIAISAPSPYYFLRINSVPTLGQPAGQFAPAFGMGKVKPSTVSIGVPPTVITNITWKSWGEPHAVGTGSGEYIGPHESANTGSMAEVTVVAFDLGICNGERMYKAFGWYYPHYGQTFNPRQYINICTGSFHGFPTG
jgi:hypothetical protein